MWSNHDDSSDNTQYSEGAPDLDGSTEDNDGSTEIEDESEEPAEDDVSAGDRQERARHADTSEILLSMMRSIIREL